MTLFAFCATLLIALSLAFVLPSLLKPQTATAAISSGRGTAWTLAVVLPAFAVGLYGLLGRPAALDAPRHGPAPVSAAPASAPAVGPAQIEAMVQRLAERLKSQPDDVEGWRRLVRSYETLGRFGDAVDAYRQLQRLLPRDPDLLTDHAVALAMRDGERLSGAPEVLIDQALVIDPNHVQALALKGSAAFERADYAAAILRWKQILTLVPPGAEIERSLRDSLAKAEALAQSRAASAPR